MRPLFTSYLSSLASASALLAAAWSPLTCVGQAADEPDLTLRADRPLTARERALRRRPGALPDATVQTTPSPAPALQTGHSDALAPANSESGDSAGSEALSEAESSTPPRTARRSAEGQGRLSSVTRRVRAGQEGAGDSILSGKRAKAVSPVSGLTGSDSDFNVTVRASSQVIYDDNIYLRRTDKVSSFIFAESVGITAALGDYESQEGNYVAIDYSPTWYIYEDASLDDNLSHQALLESQITGGRWKLGGKVALLSMEGTSADIGAIEVGDRVELNQLEASVNARYDLTGETILLASGEFVGRDYESQLDSERWRGQVSMVTSLTPRIQAGLGGAYGVLDVDLRGQETFQQAQVTLNYNATGRISLSTLLGADFRQPDGSKDHSNFVYAVAMQYTIRDGTIFALEGHRRIEPSAVLPGQNYLLTGFTAGITQRFLERFSLGVKGGYDNVEYIDAGVSQDFNRNYDYVFVRPSLTMAGSWWDAELYYLYRELTGDDDELGFANNQVGVRFGVTF